MKNNLIIASPNREKAVFWKQGLKDFIITSIITNGLDMLCDEVMRIKPDILLFDLDLLGPDNDGIVNLRRLCTETKIIIMSSAFSEGVEWELLKAGVRGCCRSDTEPDLLKQAVMAVNQGELWIRRTLTCRLIDELGKTTSKNKAYRASLGLLNKLTQREYDIALHVGNGESNKEIAQLCEISERTVKAHLSEVFHKLGVADRINLALIISADNLHQQRGRFEVDVTNS